MRTQYALRNFKLNHYYNDSENPIVNACLWVKDVFL